MQRTRILALSSTMLMLACGGVTSFEGDHAVAVMGNVPPAPPAPPAPAAPEPEPPKPEEPPPRVELRDNKIEIHEKVQFEYDKATIKEESFGLLNEVADVITKNKQIRKLAVEGHASAEGDKKHNLQLSDARAKSVMKYLVEHGIDEEKLSAKGFGSEKPIADNQSDEGREKNRRVEFTILDQTVTTKQVEVDQSGNEKVLGVERAREKTAEDGTTTTRKVNTRKNRKQEGAQ